MKQNKESRKKAFYNYVLNFIFCIKSNLFYLFNNR